MMGFYLNFTLEQYSIKNAIKHKLSGSLSKNQLTLIIITPGNSGEIKWIEKDKEIWYKGNMYDIFKINRGKDTTYYYCLNDIQEKNLMTHLDKLMKEQTSDSRSTTIQKKPIIDYLPLFISTQFIFSTPIHYNQYSAALKSVGKEILTPPPHTFSGIFFFS